MVQIAMLPLEVDQDPEEDLVVGAEIFTNIKEIIMAVILEIEISEELLHPRIFGPAVSKIRDSKISHNAVNLLREEILEIRPFRKVGKIPIPSLAQVDQIPR